MSQSPFAQGTLPAPTDLNSGLAALASSSSGLTAPASPLVGQPWFDTTTNLFKIWSGSAWLIIGRPNGPAFSATGSTTNIPNATYTRLLFPNVEFDTNGNFSSNRFTPTIPGYYSINATAFYQNIITGRVNLTIYKNGTEFKRGNDLVATNQQIGINVSALISCDGVSDYIEIYTYQITGSPQFVSDNSGITTYFQGHWVRER